MWLYLNYILQTSWGKKLIPLHFEISAISRVASDYQKNVDCMHNHCSYSQRMNFSLHVDNYELQLVWLFYIFDSYFSTFHQVLSVPKGSILGLPSVGSQYGLMKRIWRNQPSTPMVPPSHCHSGRVGKVPTGTLLKHMLTFSLEKMELNNWAEMHFFREVAESLRIFSSVDKTFYRLM